METVSATSNPPAHAIVGRGAELHWFDVMPGERMALRIHSRDVGGAFTIVEALVPPLSGPPLHLHKDREEIFEVLEGMFRFRCGSETFDVAPGTTVVVPRGVEHAWANLGAAPARIMFTFVPGGIDELFEEIGQTAPQGWAELSERYDTWVMGPALQLAGEKSPLLP